MTRIMAVRYHDISCGHRVVGHESKCKWFHGHNYRFHFTVEPAFGGLDDIGRVIDFGVIKSILCEWLEQNWDHKFLMWEEDPMLPWVNDDFPEAGFISVPFNPTAENMAKHMIEIVGPDLLAVEAVTLTKVVVDETRKCSAEAYL